MGQGFGQKFCTDQHGKGEYGEQKDTLSEQALQLRAVVRTVVEAEDGSCADGKADEHRQKEEIHVHNNAIGGDAVFPGVAQKLQIIEHAHKAHGKIVHQFRCAIGAGTEQFPAVKPASAQPQKTGIRTQEVDQRDDAAHHLRNGGGCRRTDESPAEHRHKQGIQHHIAHAGGHRHHEGKGGFLRGNAEALEGKLKDIGGHSGQHNGTVGDAVGEHLSRGAQQYGHRPQKQQRDHRENGAA